MRLNAIDWRSGRNWTYSSMPWELSMDYVRDRKTMLEGPVGDHLRFTPAQRPARVAA